MAYVDAQGFESVSNKTDLAQQGLVDTFGFNLFSKSTSRIAGGRALMFENSLSASTDISPNFAGTTTVQRNTGKLISDLWSAGGFAFGARAKFRDLGNIYTIGDQLVNNTTIVNQPVARRIVFDGTYYWSIRKNVANPNAGFEIVRSLDLTTWTLPPSVPTPVTSGSVPMTVSFSNGRVIFGYTNNCFSYTSNNGTSWTSSALFSGGANIGSFPTFSYVASTGYYYSFGTNDATNQNNVVVQKSTDLTTWTTVTTFSWGVSGNLHCNMFHDSVRQRIFFALTGNTSQTISATRLASIDYSDNVTTNWAPSLNSRIGFNSMAVDGTSTGTMVFTTTGGNVYYATGSNPTTFTLATTTNMPTATSSATNTVVYDQNSAQWIVTSSNGYIGVSTDGINWTFTQQMTTSRYNIGATFINGRVTTTGQSVMLGYGQAGTTNYGWDMKQWSQNVTATTSSTTSARASRLGVAAVNSSGRQGYVGLGYNGDLTSSSATLLLEVSNAVSNTTTLPSSVIDATNPWHYYVLIFTATSTANQFTVQVAVDGAVQTTLVGTVQLAPTSDTSSYLYWTVPVRDFAVSSSPSLIEFDDVYVFDNSGTANNSAMLDCVIMREASTGDSQAQWTRVPSSATSNAVASSGLAASATGGYVTAATAGNKDIYTTDQSIDISSYSVKAVTVEAVVSNVGLTSSSVKVGMASSGVAADTGTVAIPIGSQVFAKKVQETDPNTSNPWGRTAAKAATVTLEKVS